MNPYISLLRTNRDFRLLYVGQTISQLGDWFNWVAVSALVLDLTGSARAVAWLLIVQFLQMALVGPMAGVVVDRVNRRTIMIAADVIRGTLILGLLFVRDARFVWIAYVVMSLLAGATAFFEPARTATIPNVTSAEELMPANALASGTWSAMLAIGASIGGVVTAIFGRDIAFVIDAASFYASAAFILQTRYNGAPPPAASSRTTGWRSLTGIPDLIEGMRYVRERSHVAALMCVKTGWGLAGGVLLLLTVFGQRVFPIGGSTAAGIGVLYGARGVGAAIGPIALRWILGQQPRTLRRTIGPAFFIVGGFYLVLAGAPNLAIAALCVLCAHFGGSVLWVFSTVLLQLEVPDRFRGRVFAAELAMVTLASSLSSYWTGYELDRGGWSPRTMAFALGVLFIIPGVLWVALSSRWEDSSASLAPVDVPATEEEELLTGL